MSSRGVKDLRRLIRKTESLLEKMIDDDPYTALEVLRKEDQNKFLVKRFMKRAKTRLRKGY